MPQYYSGLRSLKSLQAEPCKFGRCPPEHNHTHNPFDASNPGYYAEPEDLIPGWTVQQIGRDRLVKECPKRCIMCWEAEADLREHDCAVLARLAH